MSASDDIIFLSIYKPLAASKRIMKLHYLLFGLVVASGLLAASHPARAQIWTGTSAPGEPWGAVASSADGSKLVAAGFYIYTSTNYGASWTVTSAPSASWQSVASSADGSKLVASAYAGPIY